jgi:dienelactone hydrolase
MKNLLLLLNLIFVFIFTGCINNIPTPKERKAKILSLVENNNFIEVDIETSTFPLFSLQNINNNCKNKNLKIYIEGDGLAWITRNTISKDPTPINLTTIKLMNQDTDQCKLYLARPCQFTTSSLCNKKYWTSHRFSSEVLNSFTDSLNHIKAKYNNSSFTLIGYSGGGAIATLLASKRDDINMIITIAGNLNIDKWTSMHNISKLEGSLNPSDYTKELENIEQYHLIGKQDDIVPKDVFLSYLSRFDRKDKIHYKLFDTTHNCCWEESYKFFLQELK